MFSNSLLFDEFEDVSDLMFDSVKGSLEEKNLLTQECENYLFELKEGRKFDFEMLKSLNNEQYIKKINV